MTRVVEHTVGHYQVQSLPYGKDYAWCPECVVVECDCGERLALTFSETTCSCGADHAELVRTELAARSVLEDDLHPWSSEYLEWLKKQEGRLRSEYYDWQEWKAI